jgi:hypothetical protein
MGSQVAAERAGREEVTMTINKLQGAISAVKEEMATQQVGGRGGCRRRPGMLCIAHCNVVCRSI